MATSREPRRAWGPHRGGMGRVPHDAGDGDSAMATKRKQSDAEKLLAAHFAHLEPDWRILTSADREYIRGLLRRGLSPEQIVPVFTAAKYQESDVRAVIEAAAPKPSAPPAPGSLLARFPGRPADTEPLKAPPVSP